MPRPSEAAGGFRNYRLGDCKNALADSPRAMTGNCHSADRPQIEKCLRDCATAWERPRSAKSQPLPGARMIIGLLNLKAGVGKTPWPSTSPPSSPTGRRVLLVDADPQATRRHGWHRDPLRRGTYPRNCCPKHRSPFAACARAGDTHAAAPPRRVMNSRRLMGLP